MQPIQVVAPLLALTLLPRAAEQETTDYSPRKTELPSEVVVVPLDSADTILAPAEERAAAEHDYVESVKRGKFSNQWVSDLLMDSGCELE